MLTNPCKHKKENSKDQSKIENRKTEVLRKRKAGSSRRAIKLANLQQAWQLRKKRENKQITVSGMKAIATW